MIQQSDDFLSIRASISLMISLLLLSSPQLVQAQSFLVKQFTTEDGLAHNVGFDIHQDRQGLLWFGTDNGLCRYNGKSFRNYTTEDGLNRSAIISLWEDPTGQLMVGPHRSGINYAVGDTFLNFPINFRLTRNPVPAYLPDGSMLIEDVHPRSLQYLFPQARKVGSKWELDYWLLIEQHGKPQLIQSNSGSLKQNKRSQLVQEVAASYATLRARLFQDASQNVFLYGKMGCWRLQWEEGFALEPAFPELANQEIECMTQDPAGNYWLIGKEEIYQINTQQRVQSHLKPASIGQIIQMEAIAGAKLYVLGQDRSSLALCDIPAKQNFRLD
ncbi:MAG: two-component regulator propeller domain-containing protein, partial [Bacteroidota bacterium]